RANCRCCHSPELLPVRHGSNVLSFASSRYAVGASGFRFISLGTFSFAVDIRFLRDYYISGSSDHGKLSVAANLAPGIPFAAK
ncbi:hypothetical protein, partial [Lysobacter sp. A3-1-A15]|uniref:hypothetical protein n=1 Tax=Novilysobacter viscosus TaxID=3098602 RepID=UPI002ED9A417